MRLKLRLVPPAFVVVLTIAFVVTIVFGHERDGSSGEPSSPSGFDGATFPAGVYAHDFTLTNQQGRRVSLSTYRGKVVMLAFLSSDCRTCVLVAQQVRGALDELESGPRPTVLFISTDPRADTRASVARFLDETSLEGRVQYLVGSTKQLQPVWRAYAISPASAGRTAVEAGTTVLLVDRHGIERVGFEVEQITPEGLAHDVRLLESA